jgi:ubiquinone/menaquinone biosynthesis C-methylase UbiE
MEDAPYDRLADAYAQHWGPVIQPAAERVLDHLAAAIDAAAAATGRTELLDVGSGTGALAIAALQRWPHLSVTGIDPSAGMLEIARRLAAERLAPDVARRYETAIGYADEIDAADETFDLAVSSFVLQLVPNRAAALDEIHRVLRRGGMLAWVAWRRGGEPYAPDRVANEVLDRFGFDPPEPDGPNGDVASPSAAAQAMRRAGFREVRAWADEVAHAWTPREYLTFLTEFDEQALFAELEPGERAQIEADILAGLAALSSEELTLRLPVVYAMGRAPG